MFLCIVTQKRRSYFPADHQDCHEQHTPTPVLREEKIHSDTVHLSTVCLCGVPRLSYIQCEIIEFASEVFQGGKKPLEFFNFGLCFVKW